MPPAVSRRGQFSARIGIYSQGPVAQVACLSLRRLLLDESRGGVVAALRTKRGRERQAGRGDSGALRFGRQILLEIGGAAIEGTGAGGKAGPPVAANRRGAASPNARRRRPSARRWRGRRRRSTSAPNPRKRRAGRRA